MATHDAITSLKLPAAQLAQLRARSEAEHITQGAFIRKALAQAFAQPPAKEAGH